MHRIYQVFYQKILQHGGIHPLDAINCWTLNSIFKSTGMHDHQMFSECQGPYVDTKFRQNTSGLSITDQQSSNLTSRWQLGGILKAHQYRKLTLTISYWYCTEWCVKWLHRIAIKCELGYMTSPNLLHWLI